MDAKHRSVQVLGSIAIALGCLLLFGTRRIWTFSHVNDLWTLTDHLMMGAVSIYLIYVGSRGIGYASGSSKPPRFGWGKILLGGLLIFVVAKNHFHPAPNLLKATNPGEAVGMMIAAIATCLFGIYLVVRGVRAGFAQSNSP